MTRPGRMLALLCATQFVLVLDVTVVGVALPAIRDDLRFDPAGLQWVVSSYVLAFGGLLLVGGRLADIAGRRRVFVAGTAVFTMGSLACGLAGSPGALIAARALQGGGAALATPAALALVTTTFRTGPERTRALGIWTAAAPVGGATGLLVGGVLTQGLGWPAVFLVNVPVGAAALVLAPRLLPRDEPVAAGGAARLDLPGAALGTAAVIALAYAFTRVEAVGPGDPITLAVLAAAGLAGVGFARRERRARNPLLPPGTLGSRPLAVGVLVSAVLTAATTPPFFFTTLHLQSVLGWSPIATGLGCLPVALAVVAGASAAPRLIGARGTGAVMSGGLALIAAGAAVLCGITADGGYATAVLPGQALYGFGLGAGSVAATTAGTAALSAARQGLASGLLNTAAQLGTALGLAVLVAVAAAVTDRGDAGPVAGFRAAFALDAALTALSAVAVAVAFRGAAPATREPKARLRRV